jgi:hypothetical protein
LWAFLRGGGDLVELGDGVGLGDLLDVLGDGEGDVELDALSVGGDDVPDEDFVSDVVGVDDGLAVDVLLGEGEADLEVLGDADADADSLALRLRGSMIAADSTAFFGGDEHVVECAACEVPAPTASALLIRLPAMNMRLVSTPIAAGRTINALTGPTSLRSAPWAGSSLLPP